jgi:uncharacterized glyoxalase superfamily protein PhnB
MMINHHNLRQKYEILLDHGTCSSQCSSRLQEVFGAKEPKPPMMAKGLVMHSLVHIGDTRIMCHDRFGDPGDPGCLPTAGDAYMYVEDVDHTHQLAVEKGAYVSCCGDK